MSLLKDPKVHLALLGAVLATATGAVAGMFLPQMLGDRSNSPLRQEQVTAETRNLKGFNASQLQALAETGQGRDRVRARYMLAAQSLEKSPSQAVKWLEGLEQEYPAMAPHVLNLRAEAHKGNGTADKADEDWREVIRRYPEQPVAAEALYALGRKDPQAWTEALERFPSHPRSVEIALERLKKTPKDVGLMMRVVRYGYYREEAGKILAQLVESYGDLLKPEDWEAIAFAHWEKLHFKEAAVAYAKAPRTARSLYRTARSLQLSEQQTKSKPVYRQVLKEFPSTKEGGLSLKRLGEIEPTDKAIPYLDRLVKEFPEHAPDALLIKAELLDGRAASDAASKVRQTLLGQYGTSEPAAELRWKLAEKYIASQNLKGAMQYASDIIKYNPTSPFAPEAGFWLGRWYQQQGQSREAAESFRTVLREFPQSYYAWRSAGVLGLPVGDFFSIKGQQPKMIPHPDRLPLATGSEPLQELYLMGQDLAAWRLWQVEYQNRQDPTVAEQYTDGMMRVGVGDTLDGLYMLASLGQRTDPQEKQQAEALKRTSAYWYGLYPLPFFDDIRSTAQELKVNPLLATALIRQESRFMPGIESVVGAQGLMQVMPETAAEIAAGIGMKDYKLKNPLDNLKLGITYMDEVHRQWKENSVLAIASYNAGPGAVGDWVQRFKGTDVDTFVEKIPFPETKGYVTSVLENYWNYMRLYNPEISKLVAQHSAKQAEMMR